MHSPLIAACVPDFGVGREILLGFHAAAAALGWSIHVDAGMVPNWDVLNDRHLVGALIGPYTYSKIIASGWRRVPLVAAEVDLTAHGIPSIRADDRAIGIAAAEHLLSRGHRNFAGFGTKFPWFLNRAEALEERITQAGARYLGTWGAAPSRPFKNEQKEPGALIPWLMNLPRPVAILAGCDNWGRMLNLWCYRAGIRIPEDIAVVGVDNDALVCETAIPPLSSVAVLWRRVGAEAARVMARILAAPDPKRCSPAPLTLIPPTEVVVRRSSDMFAVEDRNVATALRVIRDHATEHLDVPELLHHVPVGRHALQRAFRKHIGRTIIGEIRRVRVERAKSLLCTTDLTMPDIADRSGFASAAKLSEMFRRETGTTPGAFRRTFRVT
jgi:LacI family transcriptional regulator